ncbi:MAG: organic hydroperoxide resistance protein [Janthinobacterium lividum]
MKTLYTAHATSTGGRDGRSRSSDGVIDVKLAVPKEMGGGGGADATNPEQLFAAGYSACFLGALKLVAGKEKIAISREATVTADVSIGQDDSGGFGIAVVLHVASPGTDRAELEKAVQAAHQVCPYSKATRNNVDVELKVD